MAAAPAPPPPRLVLAAAYAPPASPVHVDDVRFGKAGQFQPRHDDSGVWTAAAVSARAGRGSCQPSGATTGQQAAALCGRGVHGVLRDGLLLAVVHWCCLGSCPFPCSWLSLIG